MIEDGLVIEPLGHAHAEDLVAALGDPRVAEFLPAPDVTTVAALRARIDRLALGSPRAGEVWLNFALVRDGRAIGRVEATLYDAGARAETDGANLDACWAEIAYLLGPAHQGRGDATRAVRWLVGDLRDRGARDVWAAIHPRNARSIALVHRLGFEPAAIPPARPLGSYDPGDAVFVVG